MNNSIYDTISGNNLIISIPGIYTVEVFDTIGCSATSLPFYFGVSDITNLQQPNIEIYPNPFSNSLNIKADKKIKSITIKSINGGISDYYNVMVFEKNINTSKLISNSTYLIQLYFIDGTYITRKVIKTK